MAKYKMTPRITIEAFIEKTLQIAEVSLEPIVIINSDLSLETAGFAVLSKEYPGEEGLRMMLKDSNLVTTAIAVIKKESCNYSIVKVFKSLDEAFDEKDKIRGAYIYEIGVKKIIP